MRALPTLLASVVLLTSCGGRADDRFVVGAVDDRVRHDARAFEQLREAGFEAVGVTSIWAPGLTEPAEEEVSTLRRVAGEGARVYLAVYQAGSATTPLTDEAHAQFASYAAALAREVPAIRDVIVGNEPNLNRFWLPQFGPDGGDVSAGAYLDLLATTYDALKAVDEDVQVYGGALAPRGIDRPGTGRDTHSPTAFIRDLGAAYRASGRTKPVLDAFAFHPYPASSAIPPDRSHPGSTQLGLADYATLRGLLRDAFGRDVPVLYSELGVETAVPAGKASLYTGKEPVRTVDAATQADYYRRAIELACRQGALGLLLFHSHDEPALEGFQSGLYYVNGTPKASLAPVREAMRCPGPAVALGG